VTVEVEVPAPDLSARSGATAGRAPVDPVARALTAVPVLLVLLLLAVVLRSSALHLGNDDTWFHLVLGDRFRHGWSLTHPGSLTRSASSPWVATQWSTEVLASQVESWFGLPGVAWLFGAFYCALVLGTYVSCRRVGRASSSALATLLVVIASAPVLSARPQIVSLVLLTVTVAAWLRTLRDGRPRWWLVPMTWVWATAHGLWSAGVLVGLVCACGVLLDRREGGRRAVAVLAVPVLSLVAALLTPVGPRLVLSQLAVSARTSMIAEWGPTDFRTVPALAAALALGVVVVLWLRRGGQPSWTRLGLLVLAAGWMLLVSRMVPLGAVLVAPLLSEALDGGRERALRARQAQPGRLGRTERATLVAGAVVYLLVLAVAAPRAADRPADVPAALTPRLQALPAGSQVLVEDGVGGWLEWRVPTVEPVIDGMLDAYPVGYMRDFFAATRVEPGWRGFVARSGARVGVLRAGSALVAALQHELGWRVVAHDARWVYVVAP
jgi:hypothetical protein